MAIAASAAAKIMTNKAVNYPEFPKLPYLAKATKFILAEFNISSIPIRTIIPFFRVITAKIPKQNNKELIIK